MKVKLKELGTISTGNTPSKNISEFYDSEDIGFVKPDIISDLQIEYIVNTSEYLSEAARTKARIVKKDAVFVTCIGSIGKVGIAKGSEFAFNQQINAIEPNEKILSKYLAYSIWANKKKLQAIANAPVVPIINKTQFGEFEIDITDDVDEQGKIVELLDKVCTIIADRKSELEKLDDLIKARFVEVFGERGKVVPLTDYVWFQEGPGVRSVDFTLEGTILLTGSNINDNQISFGYKSDRFISDELANGKYAHFMCDKDDILVVSSAIAPEKFDKKVTTVEEDKRYCLNTGIIRFKPNREVMTLGYFREFLKTDYFKHQVMAEMRGIAQMHFGPSHLKQMTILLPESMTHQIEFEKFVEEVDKSKVAVQKSLDEAQRLFDSLMQKYFG